MGKMYVLPCYARDRVTKTGNKFKAYYTQVSDDGQMKNLPLRFTSDVQNKPQNTCNIIVDDASLSVGYDNRGRECVWVRSIVECQNMERQGRDLSKMFTAYDDGENPFEK